VFVIVFSFIFVKKDMAIYTITINDRNKKGKSLIDFLKTLDGVEIRKEKSNIALDEALEDIKEGRVYKANDATDLINSCLK
jgi:hypothetical protein